jgi:hypothetical protein
MPTPEIVFLGMAGAFGGLLVGQLLPWAVAFKVGRRNSNITLRKLVFAVVLLATALFLGGFLAYVAQPTKRIDAVAFGLAWQTFFGGFSGAIDAAVGED